MEQNRVEAHPDELKMDNRQFQPGGDLTMAKDGLKREREKKKNGRRDGELESRHYAQCGLALRIRYVTGKQHKRRIINQQQHK